jgi:hypothetical protein
VVNPRALFAATLCTIAVLVAVPAAHADGDPASDFLLSQHVFYGADVDTGSTPARQLAVLTRDADRKRFPIRVAVITQPYDLGAVQSLWRKPQQYASFLGQELSYSYRGRLLIVMPNGFGINHFKRPTTAERTVLAKLTVQATPVGLVRGGITAVQRLAATAGVKLAVPPASSLPPLNPPQATPQSPSSDSNRWRIIFSALAAVVSLALVVVYVLTGRKGRSES